MHVRHAHVHRIIFHYLTLISYQQSKINKFMK
jgi:hypothetical protein